MQPTATWHDQMNAKYGTFVVTRYLMKTSRSVRVGKVHPTIQSALKVATRLDKRHPDQPPHFVDIASKFIKAA